VPVVGVDRDDPGTERVEGEIVEEELGPVLEEQRHPVPGPATRGGVRPAQRQHGLAGIGVRVLDVGGLVGAAGRRGRAEEGVVGDGLGRRHEGVAERCRPSAARRSGEPGARAAQELAGDVARRLAMLERHLPVDHGRGDADRLLDQAARAAGQVGLHRGHGRLHARLVEQHEVRPVAGA
jgi:hypothetical protein